MKAVVFEPVGTQIADVYKAVAERALYVDLETTLDHETIHMAAHRPLQGPDELASWTDDPTRLQQLIDGATAIVGHNLQGFDIPVMSRVWGTDTRAVEVIDTLVLARMVDPDHPGGHQLDTLSASYLGRRKMPSPDFSKLSAEMIEYAMNDVNIGAELARALMKKAADDGFSVRSIQIETLAAAIVAEVEDNGFLLDTEKALKWRAELEDQKAVIKAEVEEAFQPNFAPINGHTKNRDNLLTEPEIRAKWPGVKLEPSKKGLWRVTPVNLNSRPQLVERLVAAGWVPDAYTEKSVLKYKQSNNRADLRPKLDDEALEHCPIPEAQALSKWFWATKLSAFVDSWLAAQNPRTGRVHGRIKSIGTNTGRMAHASPNMGQVPAVKKPGGRECRECWTVREGYVLVGVDASGLELRTLAHYVNDPEFTEQILAGDVHTENQKAVKLKSRDDAKTFIYAWLYGAGALKLALIAGRAGDAAYGGRMKRMLLKRWPAIEKLLKKIERMAGNGSLPGIDGRRLYIRKAHAALNLLLQACGAVVMKVALVLLWNEIRVRGWDAKIVALVHDEFQIEALARDAEAVAEAGKWAIAEAGRVLGLRVPMAGEAKIGGNWAETH